MCDYSLYNVRNRLAEEGEELVLHRFDTGSLGFASACDLQAEASRKQGNCGFWSTLKEWILPMRPATLPAICIPPGAALLITDIPVKVQERLCIGPTEVAVFTEVSARAYSYRDALELPNKTHVLLQDLTEGIRAIVLSLSPISTEELTETEGVTPYLLSSSH